jgi:hypothetical protein
MMLSLNGAAKTPVLAAVKMKRCLARSQLVTDASDMAAHEVMAVIFQRGGESALVGTHFGFPEMQFTGLPYPIESQRSGKGRTVPFRYWASQELLTVMASALDHHSGFEDRAQHQLDHDHHLAR